MYLRSDGTLTRSTQSDDIEWKYVDDNSLCEQIDYLMQKMHSILMEIERELSFEIDFHAILNSEAMHILRENKFTYSTECSGRKNIFLSKLHIKGNTLEQLVFCFVRRSEYGYDVIRFEIVETTLVICCRLLFFPETRKTMEIQVDDLLSGKDRELLNMQITGTRTYVSLVQNYLRNFNDIDAWFNSNRPGIKTAVNNMGIYP